MICSVAMIFDYGTAARLYTLVNFIEGANVDQLSLNRFESS
jgi:hypothetical protein